ncbi:MAG: uracil-DNA glycosylase family protein [Pseudomonadota bacterium]
MLSDEKLEKLLVRVRACTHCKEHLPLGPRPVLQMHNDARILIAGQAPGRLVHASGIPFNDPSGRRLRNWMGIDEQTFYDARKIAILPMGFCYPGSSKSGDLPPRPECAPLWRDLLLDKLQNLRLTLVIGAYAQRWHLGTSASLTARVRDGLKGIDSDRNAVIALPHPSPRNNRWLKQNEWFEIELVPKLQAVVRRVLETPMGSD